MDPMDSAEYSLETLACHAGRQRTGELENSEAIFTTSSFCFDNAAQAAARFAGEEPGNVYSRFTNPTVRAFEDRLAAMEGGERCIATSSGMAAIMMTCLSLLKAGDHIVSSRSVFGTTVNLFKNILSRFKVDTTFVDLTDLPAWSQAITPHTKLLFVETPSNPLTEVGDIAALSALARERDCLLIVDNCFCTPALQRPFLLGADLVIHSATKFLDGQGRCIGGAVIGPADLLEEKIFPFLRNAGPCMSPFNAWVFLKGLETLAIRMERHSENALRVAEWLDQQLNVTKTYYPGLPSHPQYELAAQQQSGNGGIVSFVANGGREAAWAIIDKLKLFSITANLGDTKSIVTHPASTTHGRISDEERKQMGISEGLVRLSIGLEDPQDLIADLAQAFND